MDALDVVRDAAEELLARAQRALDQAGAPADHPLWPLLRTVRVAAPEAVRAVVALRPDPLPEAGVRLGRLVAAYRRVIGGEPGAGVAPAGPAATPFGVTGGRAAEWTGAAADAYTERARAVTGYVSGEWSDPAGGVLGRASATAAYADELADWIVDTRLALAGTLAEALVSRQALTLHAADPLSAEAGLAAADVTARVLATVAEAYERASRLLTDRSPPGVRPFPDR